MNLKKNHKKNKFTKKKLKTKNFCWLFSYHILLFLMLFFLKGSKREKSKWFFEGFTYASVPFLAFQPSVIDWHGQYQKHVLHLFEQGVELFLLIYSKNSFFMTPKRDFCWIWGRKFWDFFYHKKYVKWIIIKRGDWTSLTHQ